MAPLLMKELRGVLGGRSVWIMLLLMCPLIGYSYVQALALYGEASVAGQQSPVLASSLAPMDGVLVPTFGATYIAMTLLFPFVAIRILGHEKETGALSLLIQLPYRASALVGAKLATVLLAWLIASVPVLSAVAAWGAAGGHLSAAETGTLVLGHLLYGMLIGAIALFAASIADSAATAAIITLAFTIGSWVLDFTLVGQPGILEWLARLSLTQILRPFEQGLLPLSVVAGAVMATLGFAGLATVWLPPGVSARSKLIRSAICVLICVSVVAVASKSTLTRDVSEDRRNSFSLADESGLAKLTERLIITVHLAREDPRYADLRRNVLAKLERVMPKVTIRLAGNRQIFSAPATDDRYGEIELAYGARSDTTRSTSPREILPIIYSLAGVGQPAPIPGGDYPGYPLIANETVPLIWFLGILPLLILLAWWWSRRPPRYREFTLEEVKS